MINEYELHEHRTEPKEQSILHKKTPDTVGVLPEAMNVQRVVVLLNLLKYEGACHWLN